MPAPDIQLSFTDGTPLVNVSTEQWPGPPCWVIKRTELIAILLSAAAQLNISITRNTAATAIQNFTTHFRIELAEQPNGVKKSLIAELIIVASGVRDSPLNACNPSELKTSTITLFRGIASYSIAPAQAQLVVGKQAEFGYLPLSSHETYWFAGVKTRDLRLAKNSLTEYFSKWAEPLSEIINGTVSSAIYASEVTDYPQRRSLFAAKGLRVGDAAHSMRPHLGQGACQAIEDGAALLQACRDTTNISDAFSQFVTLRGNRAKRLAYLSRAMGSLIFSPASSSKLLVTGTMKLIPPQIFQKILRKTLQ